MPLTTPTRPTTSTHPSAGGRLVATDGRELPLREVQLDAQAGGGIARVVVTQRFANPYDTPLEVRYLLPLPSNGAVSGYAFTLEGERVVGEVTGREEAKRRFEQALVEGRTAALLEQDRTSLFTQRVGNVPPKSEITAEVTVDQPLRWLDEGEWEWRFPTVVGPRYQGEEGRVADAAKLAVPVADGGLAVRASLDLAISDPRTGPVDSPSHGVAATGERLTAVRFDADGEAGVPLDRDVVVRWPVAAAEARADVLVANPDSAAHDGDQFALVTVVPPATGGQAVPRDLTFLLDTSGSMGGRPLEQARRVVGAMLATLTAKDRFEMIAFGSRPVRWKKKPVVATAANTSKARKWLEELEASGSTEMHLALLDALAPLRESSQRQVVLVTDGYIGFESQIISSLLTKLPKGARLHTVGVGGAINRSLTEAAARAGRGTELIVGLEEDPDKVVGRLLARTTAPIVTDLTIEGAGLLGAAPRQLPDLYAGAPALLGLRFGPDGGEVVIRGALAKGDFEQRMRVPPCAPGEGNGGIAALFARERIADLEMELTAGGSRAEAEASIAEVGIAFQIASRLTSWVAVSSRVTVDPDADRKLVEQPHQLPYGVSAEGLGLRQAAPTRARSAVFSPREGSMAETSIMPARTRVLSVESEARAAPPPKKRMKVRRRPAPSRKQEESQAEVYGAPPAAGGPPASLAPPPSAAPPPPAAPAPSPPADADAGFLDDAMDVDAAVAFEAAPLAREEIADAGPILVVEEVPSPQKKKASDPMRDGSFLAGSLRRQGLPWWAVLAIIGLVLLSVLLVFLVAGVL